MSAVATGGVCLSDVDCPDNKVCFVRELAWTNGTSVCDCMGWYGKFGPSCDEPAPYFYVSVLAIACSVCAASVLAVLSLRDVRLVWKHLGGVAKSPSNATPVFTTAALLFLVGWKLSCLLEFLVPIHGEVILVRATGKTTVITQSTDVLQFLVMFFTTMSLLNLSLMWLEVSRDAVRVAGKAHRKISKYRAVCIAMSVLVVTCNLVLVILQRAHLALHFVVPTSLIIGMLFIAGRRGMQRVLAEGSTNAAIDPSSAIAQRMHKARVSIDQCCKWTVFWISLFDGCSALWSWVMVLRVPLSGWREYTRPGVGCWPQIVFEGIAYAIIGTLHQQYLYSHSNIADRLGKRIAPPNQQQQQQQQQGAQRIKPAATAPSGATSSGELPATVPMSSAITSTSG